MRSRADFWRVLLWLALPACSAVVETDTRKLGPPVVGCVPNTLADCPCPDGTFKKQRCNGYGRYDPCMCVPSASGAGSGGR